jgi:hypothetical protein
MNTAIRKALRAANALAVAVYGRSTGQIGGSAKGTRATPRAQIQVCADQIDVAVMGRVQPVSATGLDESTTILRFDRGRC